MVRGPSGQIFVQQKTNAPRRKPTECDDRERLTLECVKERVIPHQEMHGELGPLIDQRGQKTNKPSGVSVVPPPALAHEPRAAVEVPTDDEYSRARLKKGLPEGAKIVGAINQHRGPPGPL